ncbi:MAG: protein-L-isoaspartate(D-aspartate) O-methyltransferase [Deltaproteobacteria bacterium]|nr:protein-L-isoaspartate(D-aspartate) O-methyltransferase [Deltaproteobacteria bacterium]
MKSDPPECRWWTVLSALLLWAVACAGPRCGASFPPVEGDVYDRLRERMVSAQIEARGIEDPAVLKALRKVERHRFVLEESREHAYEDHAMSIGLGQTISQPYVVAAMSEALELEAGMKVLEIGTGSGYQAAVLAEMGAVVHTIEIVPDLARRSAALLAELGYGSVKVVEGDGYLGLPEEAPFDRVIITAAPPKTPQPPLDQLVEGGLMVLPVGEHRQDLVVLKKTPSGVVRRDLFRVRFVPMVHGKGY